MVVARRVVLQDDVGVPLDPLASDRGLAEVEAELEQVMVVVGEADAEAGEQPATGPLAAVFSLALFVVMSLSKSAFEVPTLPGGRAWDLHQAEVDRGTGFARRLR
jgi:hypothetical protein